MSAFLQEITVFFQLGSAFQDEIISVFCLPNTIQMFLMEEFPQEIKI